MTVTINKETYTVDEINRCESTPLTQANLQANGWTAYALIRRTNGKRQYVAVINENNGHAAVL